jgi:hypothetical protein
MGSSFGRNPLLINDRRTKNGSSHRHRRIRPLQSGKESHVHNDARGSRRLSQPTHGGITLSETERVAERGALGPIDAVKRRLESVAK